MQFEPGETVVYPHHGAATILEVNKRKVKGDEKLFLKLKVHESRSPHGVEIDSKIHKTDLIIEIPAEQCEIVGVRDVIDKDDLEQVFKVLQEPFTEEHSNWSRRYKANTEKLASGDVMKISEVVRDLWRREQDRGLSTGEKSLLAKARHILVSEVALAKKIKDDAASELLDQVLAA